MSEYWFTTSSGTKIPVVIENRRGARNITLRPKTTPTQQIHMSKPWFVSINETLKFLESKRRWTENVFNKAPKKISVRPGDCIEICGHRFNIRHDPSHRSNELVGDNLIIGGNIDMFNRRVRDFVKSYTLVEIKKIIKTTPREFWPTHITLRDTTSRWGSCSSTRTMSFSWRLAFAPYDVLRYVVMHELSHTKHMDHSPEFWQTVSELYGFGVERARRWLTKNGSELHRYF